MKIQLKIIILILGFPLLTCAQSSNKYVEKQKLRDFFDQNIPFKTTKDSSAAYAFSFKIFVEKNNLGVAKVISISASDSIAFKIYPMYKLLENIKYDVFMGNSKAATFIIPVGIEVINSKGDKVPRSDFFDDIMSLFNFKAEDDTQPEIFTYFKAHLIRMNKQVTH